MFWEYMQKGMAHGGYVLGLVLVILIAAGAVALFVSLMGMAFGESEETDKEAFEERRDHRVRKDQQPGIGEREARARRHPEAQ